MLNKSKSRITGKKPQPGDYPPYYDVYLPEVLKEDNIIDALNRQKNETYKILKSIPDEKTDYAYAPGKWTVKEVLGHIIDSERVFAYRALCFARNERHSLPGFEQDDYVREGIFNERNFSDLIEEYMSTREANLLLFNGFSDEVFEHRGVANNYEVTVLALLFIIAGHERHHIKILKERYLGQKS